MTFLFARVCSPAQATQSRQPAVRNSVLCTSRQRVGAPTHPIHGALKNEIRGPNLSKKWCPFSGSGARTCNKMVTIFFHPAPGQLKTSRPPSRFLGCSMLHLPVHLVSRQVLPHIATPKLYSTSTPPISAAISGNSGGSPGARPLFVFSQKLPPAGRWLVLG